MYILAPMLVLAGTERTIRASQCVDNNAEMMEKKSLSWRQQMWMLWAAIQSVKISIICHSVNWWSMRLNRTCKQTHTQTMRDQIENLEEEANSGPKIADALYMNAQRHSIGPFKGNWLSAYGRIADRPNKWNDSDNLLCILRRVFTHR